MLQTEYDFKLPKGFIGDDGKLQRNGKMRMAILLIVKRSAIQA